MAQVKNAPGSSSSAGHIGTPTETPPMRQPFFTPSPQQPRVPPVHSAVKQEQDHAVDVRALYNRRRAELDLLKAEQSQASLCVCVCVCECLWLLVCVCMCMWEILWV